MKIILQTVIVITFAVTMSGVALAQGPPGGGGPPGQGGNPPGGGQPTTLDSLGCTVAGDIARLVGVDWECSSDLTDVEADVVTAQSTADGAQANADAAQTAADNAQTTADDAVVRVGVLEGQNLDSRVTVLENASSSEITLESLGCSTEGNIAQYLAGSWVCSMAVTDLDTRVTALENVGGGDALARVILVPADGTPAENGQALLDAVAEGKTMTPTFTNPVVIQLDAGTYNVTPSRINLNGAMSLVGQGPKATTVTGKASIQDPANYVISMNGPAIQIRDLTVDIDRTPGGLQTNVGGISIEQDKDGGIIRNVHILGPNGSHDGIKNGPFSETFVEDVVIKDVFVGIANYTNAEITFENLESAGGIANSFSVGTIVGKNSRVHNLFPGTGGTITLFGTQVTGSKNNTANITCVFSYDGSYQPLDGNCL